MCRHYSRIECKSGVVMRRLDGCCAATDNRQNAASTPQSADSSVQGYHGLTPCGLEAPIAYEDVSMPRLRRRTNGTVEDSRHAAQVSSAAYPFRTMHTGTGTPATHAVTVSRRHPTTTQSLILQNSCCSTLLGRFSLALEISRHSQD